MSEAPDVAATIDGLNRLLSDRLAPELARQEAAIEHFLDEARQARERVHAVVAQAETELTAPFDAADQVMDEFEALLDLLGTALDPAETANTALFDSEIGDVGSRLDDAKQRFLAVEQVLCEGRGNSEAAATTADGEIEQLIGAIEAACDQLAQAAEQAGEHLDGARDRIDRAVTTLDTALGEMQEAVNKGLEALEKHVDDEAKYVAATVTDMLDTAREAIGDFCGTSDEVLGDLSGAADKLSELFGGEAKEILDKVKELLAVIEKIRPLLEAVEQWT
jgi:chromosome segregation ATPase